MMITTFFTFSEDKASAKRAQFFVEKRDQKRMRQASGKAKINVDDARIDRLVVSC
jgi:hypothetical protein